MFSAELIDFCNNNKLCFIDREKLPQDSFTFVSQAHGTTSWLDHCITTTSGQSITSNISIIDDIVCSDHFPLCIEIVCDVNKLHDATLEIKPKTTVKWHTANEADKQRYNTKTKQIASTIVLPTDALLCKNTNCTEHHDDIDNFYDSIIAGLKSSANLCIPSSNVSNKVYVVPGWNEYDKEHNLHAKDALWWWNFNNRPQYGLIYDNMRTTRAHFKYALRFAKRQRETAEADSLARDLSNKDVDHFWKTVHKLNSNSTTQANVIDGISGQDNIANYWRDHFYKILNTNDCDKSLKDGIVGKLEDIQHSTDMAVSTKCISEIIAKLECGKSAGPDEICAEYLKFSNVKLHTLLALCFSLCLSHGYLPIALIETTIIPIVKNKSGNLSDSNNYRPIALATIVSRILESVLLIKCGEYLTACDNQFGFKSCHSTDLCIYTLKEFIEYYKNRGTTVYVTFLDASKAFHRLNYWLLFDKLIKKNIPFFIIKLLCFRYTHQQMFVRWGNTISTHFTVANGVKQGRVISPILFNIYMDKLSIALNSSGIGGYLGNLFLNHLCYADDLCLISLSSAGMQQLLNICQNYAMDQQLLYNGSKSYSLCFKSKSIKITQPSFYLNLLKITIVENCRYLGITISTKNSDLDLKRQMRKIYANTNLLLKKFSKCSVDVKCYLFKTYCSNLYCAPMWFDCTKTALKKLKVAYNNSLGRFMILPWRNSAREMFANLGIPSIDELLRIFVFGFRSRIIVSTNLFISSIYNSTCRIYSCMCRGGSRMVGALRHTTWWGPLRRIAQKNFRVKSDIFKTRQILIHFLLLARFLYTLPV